MSLSRSTPGSRIHVAELARGGMGSVEIVLRKEGEFSRLLAVKRLLPEYRNVPEFRQMFLNEARVAGLLRHPNIISVLDVGEDAQSPYLVMDYIEGLSLSRLIRATSKRGGLLPVQLCLRICRDVAAGLHNAHELRSRDGEPLNLVHRDVTPQNVLLSYAGEVLVADFGIAKAIGSANKTSTGVLKGKIGYMSPEQLRFREPDRRSDLFALGVVLYEMLAGVRAYGGEGMTGARKILEEPPPDILEIRDDVPDEIVALLFELLAKEPADRPPTADEVKRRLDEALSTLLLDEEPLTVQAYLDEHFREEREASRRRLDAQIADATERSEARQGTSGKSSLAWPVAAAALLIVGAGALWGSGVFESEPVPVTEETPALATEAQEAASGSAPVAPVAVPLPPETEPAAETDPPRARPRRPTAGMSSARMTTMTASEMTAESSVMEPAPNQERYMDWEEGAP